MTFDGFFIYHLTKELNQSLMKSRLEKVYQKDEQSFVFIFYIKKERHHLIIDLDPNHFGMYLSEQEGSYQQSSQFLSTLKKHLEGAILDEITQYQTDRVMICHFTVYDFILGPIKKMLIFEAMGKHSNLILVQDNIILDTYKKMFFESGRQLLPQAAFEFFPSDKKTFDYIQYEEIHSSQDLVNTYMGISPLLAKYLIEHPVQLSDIKLNPTYVKSNKKSYLFDLFDEHLEKVYVKCLSKLFEIEDVKQKPSYLSQRQFITKQLKKYEKKREILNASLEASKEGLNERNIGDTIYSSGYPLHEKHSEIEVDGQRLALDPTLTLNENAQKHYKNYQKYKRSIEHIEAQIDENESLIDIFTNLDDFIDLQSDETIKDFDQELKAYGYKAIKQKVIHRKHQQKPNYIVIEDDYALYAIGKNNIQNEYLTHTYAHKDDYWFHVKDAPGAHVIVQTKALIESVQRKACMLAAYFSKLKNSSSIPVDYTRVRHIKKIPGKPGYHVIYTQNKTMYIDIDEDLIIEIMSKALRK